MLNVAIHKQNPLKMNNTIFVMKKEEKIKVAYNVYKTTDNYKEACRITGISPNTYYRWRRKFRGYGVKHTLKKIGKWGYDKHPSNKTPGWVRKKIEMMRKEDNYGAVKISHILKRDFNITIHSDTVSRILREKGLNRTRRKYPKRSKGTWDRVIPFYPGDLVQADPVQFGDLWVVNMQDVLIKWRSAFVAEELTVECMKKNIKESIKQFPFKVKNIQWDNGSETEKDFAECLGEIQLRHTAPASPWQNGMIERLNGITREEEFGISKFKRKERRKLQKLLKVKVKKYNEYRPHHSLGLKTPLEMWEACLRDQNLMSFVKIAND